MVYSPNTWRDYQAGGTLMNAARLNHAEGGIVEASRDSSDALQRATASERVAAQAAAAAQAAQAAAKSAGTLAMGTVTMAAEGSAPQATIRESNGVRYLDLTLPRGPEGLPGGSAPTDQVIAQLLAGPSATTTAADARYARRGHDVINVLDYATGDGTTNDAPGFNRAIVDAAGRPVFVPAGTYAIDATSGVKVNTPGTQLIMSPGAVLKVIPNDAAGYSAVEVIAADCTIMGGTIMGDVRTHTGTTGEWGHLLVIAGSAHRAKVIGTTVTEAWGDGIAVQGGPSDVWIDGVLADSNRRQGISLIAATRPRVSNCLLVNTGRIKFTGPGAGLDIEPNPNSGLSVVDAKVSDCVAINNVGPGFLAVAAANVSTVATIIGCTSKTSASSGFYVTGLVDASGKFSVAITACDSQNNTLDGFAVEVAGTSLVDCEAISNAQVGFRMSKGTGYRLTNPAAINNGQAGIQLNIGSDRAVLSGGMSRGNSQAKHGTYSNVDVWGVDTRVIGHESDAGTGANLPALGFMIRSGATNCRLLACDSTGTYTVGPIRDDGGAVVIPSLGIAKAAAIASPTADVASLKTAVDALRAAVKSLGATA